MRYFEEVQESIGLLQQRADDVRRTPISRVFNQTIADPTRDFGLADGYNEFSNGDNFQVVLNGILQEINSREVLQDVWVARCPLVS